MGGAHNVEPFLGATFTFGNEAAYAIVQDLGAGARQAVHARGFEGREYFQEGPDILEHAAKGCPELDAALQVWKDVTFDFQSTDTPDYAVTPTVA